MAEFTAYEKMADSTSIWKSKNLDHIKEWVALEKVHGANFSFTVYKESESLVVKIARRNDFLTHEEKFFGINEQEGFIESECEKASCMFQAIQERGKPSDIQSITIYGELFGGHYPHPSVPQQPKVSTVQKEVVYCPDLKFIAFDIATMRKDVHSKEYLDYDICMKLFKENGFLYAEPLITGSLQDMFNFPLGFNSTIPAKLGLPPLPEDIKNTAEGVVVKPLKNTVIECRTGMKRVIFKRKVKGFCERRPRKKDFTAKEKQYSHDKCQQDYLLIKYELFALVTEQRVVNTISKLGLPEESDALKPLTTWDDIQKALLADVMDELKREEELWGSFITTPKLFKDQLIKETGKECTQIIEDYKLKFVQHQKTSLTPEQT